MFDIVVEHRRASVLTRPRLPCLAGCYTINLTAGCPFGCRYCYARGYPNNPGQNRVKFYADSDQKLLRELGRNRHRPRMVYFSTATDPFVPDTNVLDAQFRIMETLLQRHIPILILTKAKIPPKFIEMFAHYHELVQVQIGQTTTDDRIRALLEPDAAAVDDRLRNIAELRAANIGTELRMDPLIPLLTDTDRSLRMLFKEVSSRGCSQAVASYLHLRQSNCAAMSIKHENWDFEVIRRRLYLTTATLANGDTKILLPTGVYLRDRYQAIAKIGSDYGIDVKSCGCKNPDLTCSKCHPQPTGMDRQTCFEF